MSSTIADVFHGFVEVGPDVMCTLKLLRNTPFDDDDSYRPLAWSLDMYVAVIAMPRYAV
jgi:hypothetical protein